MQLNYVIGTVLCTLTAKPWSTVTSILLRIRYAILIEPHVAGDGSAHTPDAGALLLEQLTALWKAPFHCQIYKIIGVIRRTITVKRYAIFRTSFPATSTDRNGTSRPTCLNVQYF